MPPLPLTLTFTTVLATQNWLYATYSTYVSGSSSICADTGFNAANRVPSSVLGCPTIGVLARFPLASDGSLSASALPEIILGGIDDAAAHRPCAQFYQLGIDSVIAGPDNAFYVSVGVGALDLPSGGLDIGQYGTNPCSSGTSTLFGGHFRAQDPMSWSGKILRVIIAENVGATPAVTVFASGLHNPWRMAFIGSSLLALDTAGYNSSTEEISFVNSGDDLGWPCVVGANSQTSFTNLDQMRCLRTVEAAKKPFFTYDHPGKPGTFSALAYHALTNRYVFADYTAGKIFSFSATEMQSTFTTSPSLTIDWPVAGSMIPVFAAHLINIGNEIWSVDVVKGTISGPVPVGMGVIANPNATSFSTSASADDTSQRLGLGLGLGLGLPFAALLVILFYCRGQKHVSIAS